MTQSHPSVSRRIAHQTRIVTSPQDREAVARLRYEVYVEELDRNRDYADHEARTLHEKIDDEGLILGAFTAEGRAIGTIRLVQSTAVGNAWRELYQWENREREVPLGVYVASKLIVASDQRGTLLGIEMMRSAAAEAYRRGWRYCFLETYDNLLELYERMGFVVRRRAQHPVYGAVIVMEWDMYDVEHMRSVRSPLLKTFAECAAERTFAA